ncbi:MAG: hypothetical protein M3Q97_00560 [Bacteroidota bacterium]|nr:hypothetical protein [Bacteroidota bacterium]
MKKLLFLFAAFMTLGVLTAGAQHMEGDEGKTYYDVEKTKPKEIFNYKEIHSFDPNNPKEMQTTTVKHGPYFYYYENGKLKITGYYRDGQKHGEWKYYSADGKLDKTEKYDNGKLIG